MAEISIAYRNGMVVAKPLSDDDEDESPGRILTVEEFIDRLRNRTDIFGVDKNKRLRNVEVITLLFALVAGFFAASRVPSPVIKSDFYERDRSFNQNSVAVLPGIIDRNLNKPTAVRKPAAADVKGRRISQKKQSDYAHSHASVENGGSGSIRSRIANNAFFSSLAQITRGIDAERGDLFGKGGVSEKLDALLAGKGGLSKGGMTSTGRKGYEHIGYGPGHGKSGFDGDGPGGDNDIFDAFSTPAESASPLTLKTGPPDRIRTAAAIVTVPPGIMLNGAGRSRVDIMRVVMQNLSALRYAYNQRLRERPGLTGKITIKFAVDEFGNVIACDVIESSMADNQLETVIKGKILRWRFDKIDKPGDITEVVYPFVFST